MSSIIVKVKILEHGKGLDIPKHETSGSAGVDLRAAIEKDILIFPNDCPILVPTGICIKLRQGYEAQIRSRSGLAYKHGIVVANSPGTIDSDYTGEIKIILTNIGKDAFCLKRGNKIAQMVVSKYCKIVFNSVDFFQETKRGQNGFGSTGI